MSLGLSSYGLEENLKDVSLEVDHLFVIFFVE